jgi:hypothetical protein
LPAQLRPNDHSSKKRSATVRSHCPSRARTWTFLIQSQACCQLHQGAVRARSLFQGICSTGEEGKSGRRGSNPRPSAWEADALPTELLPRWAEKYNESARKPPEPPVGIEPTTARLRIECSTTELRWRGLAARRRGGTSLSHGAEGNRTPDLCSAIAALSHLSYGPAIAVSHRLSVYVLPYCDGRYKTRTCDLHDVNVAL